MCAIYFRMEWVEAGRPSQRNEQKKTLFFCEKNGYNNTLAPTKYIREKRARRKQLEPESNIWNKKIYILQTMLFFFVSRVCVLFKNAIEFIVFVHFCFGTEPTTSGDYDCVVKQTCVHTECIYTAIFHMHIWYVKISLLCKPCVYVVCVIFQMVGTYIHIVHLYVHVWRRRRRRSWRMGMKRIHELCIRHTHAHIEPILSLPSTNQPVINY